jgi:nicotinate-nucleotide adenylyltransferase
VNEVAFGVFGGSFDPPHVAHTLLASYALSVYQLERVLIVPTHSHAFGKRLASFEDRLRMCELAFSPLQRIEICSVERELPTPSLTANTLRALAQRYPGVQLRLLIGSDILQEVHAWHDFASIERSAPPIVVQRSGAQAHGTDADQPALPAVSSSEIRRRLSERESTHGWLAASVAEYIHGHGLYRNP